MSRITAIEPQLKNSRRVNIYLDGEFAFGLSDILAAWLKVGQDVSEEKIASLQAGEVLETAYQKALHFVNYRPRSSVEIRQNLEKRGYEEIVIEQTLCRLQQGGLVNDEAFAQTWIENRNAFRPRSKYVLRMELRRKGISSEIIQSKVDAIVEDDTLALQAARKQLHRYSGLEWPEFRQKMGGFLARRGFSFTTLAPVLSTVWEELQMAETGNKNKNEEE